MKYLIQSQVFIALIAVAYSVETELLLNQKPGLHPYLFLIFLATFLVYNLSRISFQSKPVGITWYLFVLVIAAAVMVVVSFWAHQHVIVVLIPLAIMSVLYTFPLFPFQQKLVTLREVPYIKIFIITLVWGLTTVLVPVVRLQQAFDLHVTLILIERIIFVFVLALMFDIRDMEQDQRSGLRTFPLWLGEEKSKKLCKGLLILFLLMAVVHYWENMFLVLPAMILSAVGASLLLNNMILKDKPDYYFALVDSMMLVQAALVFISFWLSENWI